MKMPVDKLPIMCVIRAQKTQQKKISRAQNEIVAKKEEIWDTNIIKSEKKNSGYT